MGRLGNKSPQEYNAWARNLAKIETQIRTFNETFPQYRIPTRKISKSRDTIIQIRERLVEKGA